MAALNNASERYDEIQRQLKENGSVSVCNLVEQFGVSRMTIHRDLDLLVEAGVARKRRGGAVFIRPKPAQNVPGTCAMCATPVKDRTAMLIQSRSRGQLGACCPHCGLMMTHMLDDVDLVLARDFLHGRMINAFEARFLVNPDVDLCCVPSTLCFSAADDAERFQLGFGGDVLTFEGAITALRNQHRTP